MLNKLKPDTIKKINEQKLPFKQMENIDNYTRACKGLGIPDMECFATVDLFEEKDFNLVRMCVVLQQMFFIAWL